MSDKDHPTLWQRFNNSEQGKELLNKYIAITKEKLDEIDATEMNKEEFLKLQEDNPNLFNPI